MMPGSQNSFNKLSSVFWHAAANMKFHDGAEVFDWVQVRRLTRPIIDRVDVIFAKIGLNSFSTMARSTVILKNVISVRVHIPCTRQQPLFQYTLVDCCVDCCAFWYHM